MSRSELPRLKGNAGAPHQAANLPQVRNPAIEAQRMKTAILGQIQSVQSEQERQVQQIEAQISLISRELTPKMQNIQRHNAFNQQQLDELLARISQIATASIPKISETNEELQKKFENTIRAKAQTRLRPLGEEIELEKTRLEKLSETIVSGLATASDQLKKLSKEHDESTKKALELHGKVKARLEALRPKIAAMESKLASYSTVSDVSFVGGTSGDALERTARKLRNEIAQLENTEMQEAVQSTASETLASITSVTNNIEQKFAAMKAGLANMESAVKTAYEEQEAADAQLEEAAETSSKIEQQMDEQSVQLHNKLGELEAALDKLSREMHVTLADLNEEREGNSSWTVRGLADDIESLRTIASQKLNQLKEDWLRFHGDNRTLQETVDDHIDEIVRVLNGKLNLIKRVEAAEQRAKWCVERLNAWQREEERKKALDVSDEVLWAKLAALEQKLYETEERLHNQDGEEAPPVVVMSDTAEWERPIAAPPTADPGDPLPLLQVPCDLKLAYDGELEPDPQVAIEADSGSSEEETPWEPEQYHEDPVAHPVSEPDSDSGQQRSPGTPDKDPDEPKWDLDKQLEEDNPEQWNPEDQEFPEPTDIAGDAQVHVQTPEEPPKPVKRRRVKRSEEVPDQEQPPEEIPTEPEQSHTEQPAEAEPPRKHRRRRVKKDAPQA